MFKATTLLAIVSLNGLCAPAGAVDPGASPFPQDLVPFEMSRNSVLNLVPLKVGDLSLVSELEAKALESSAARDPSVWERCLQSGPDWLRWSDDRKSLEFKSFPWGLPYRTRIMTAYCDDGNILIGGYERRAANDDSHKRWWIFLVAAGGHGPTKHFGDEPLALGSWGRYTLNEVRAIDPVSRRMLFAGTSEDGKEALLAAPFAIIPWPSARQ